MSGTRVSAMIINVMLIRRGFLPIRAIAKPGEEYKKPKVITYRHTCNKDTYAGRDVSVTEKIKLIPNNAIEIVMKINLTRLANCLLLSLS